MKAGAGVESQSKLNIFRILAMIKLARRGFFIVLKFGINISWKSQTKKAKSERNMWGELMKSKFLEVASLKWTKRAISLELRYEIFLITSIRFWTCCCLSIFLCVLDENDKFKLTCYFNNKFVEDVSILFRI